MTPFACGHAAHPDWRMALTMAAAQIDAQPQPAPTLSFVYFTDHYTAHTEALLAALRQR